METRFSDDIEQNTDGNDFIVRRRRPFAAQIGLLFTLVVISIYTTAILIDGAGGGMAFIAVLVLTIGALGFFTIMLTQRNRDLVMATEFQNAMLASAAQLSTRFCLITKRDGTIVYIDPGFQKIFPHFMQSSNYTVDGLLVSADVPDDIYRQISQAFEKQSPLSITIPFKNSAGNPMPMVVTMDLLPRPRGYFLFRGRDFVEKRHAAEGKMALAEPPQKTSLFSLALHSMPGAVLLVNHNYEIVYASPLMEEWLGFAKGEIQASPQRFEHICNQYQGSPVARIIVEDFEGALTLHRKDRSLISVHAVQRRLQGAESGIFIICEPLEEAKKKLSAEPALPASPELSAFVASLPVAVARIAANGIVIECNDALQELSRRKVDISGWKFLDLVREDSRADVATQIEKLTSGQAIPRKPLEITLATDDSVTVSLYLSRIGGSTPEIIAQLVDTTEQKNLEQRFAHSQKMQAVGQLAGGVAHDFNNLLTAMIGFCDLLLIRHPAGDQSFADIMQVKQNANRAANLVRQLLAFSRRQTLQPKMLDITDVLAELSNLVRRLIGENIELKVVHGRDLGMVKADQGQLEQVFINLAVNARDAMQGGGKLTIQTSHVTVDRAHPISRNLVPPLEDEAITPGDYVLVEVIDTGTGIPRNLLQKIFEPFFSTKEVGSGTGLGLATVYGIIKQTGGYIYVGSKEGEGTNFSLFFKRYQHEENKPAPEQAQAATTDDLTGKGTVLLVEDETPVRTFAARALRNKGYTVLEADCGESAVEVMEAQGSEVDVIISDVIMPGMNGPTMIDTIAPKFPRVKVIFISGYAEDIFVKNYGSEREFNFLPKPFTLKQLASKVKEVMAK